MAVALEGPQEYQTVLSRLERLSRRRWGWMARCPAHDDNRGSLSISIASDDGRMLLKCHAGCATDAIVAAIGCELKDLFNRGSTMERKIIAQYDYRDEQGKTLFQVVRFEPKDFRQRHPDGNGWAWGLNGVRRVLYRLPDLIKAPRRGVVIVEGEKDADRLVSLGLLATTNSAGAGKWSKEYSESLRGRRCVIIPDNDQPGRDHAKLVADALQGIASFVAVLELDGLPEKGDVSDWLDAGHTADELKQRIQDALKPPKEEDRAPSGKVRRILDTAKGLDRQSLMAAIHGLLNELEIQNLG